MGKGIYALVAIIRTEGKESRMSDDLISREAVLEILYDISDRNYGSLFGHGINRACDVIKHAETAFDKEKVIEELVELRQKEYSDSDEEIEIIDGEEIYDEGRSQGRFEAYHRAIKIVQKGGTE